MFGHLPFFARMKAVLFITTTLLGARLVPQSKYEGCPKRFETHPFSPQHIVVTNQRSS